MTPTPLQKQFDFYWPCVDIRVYISSQIFSIPSLLHPPHPPPPPPPPPPPHPHPTHTHTNTHTHTLFIREKKAGPIVWYWYRPVKGFGTPSSSSEQVLETDVRFFVQQHCCNMPDHGAFSGQFVLEIGCRRQGRIQDFKLGRVSPGLKSGMGVLYEYISNYYSEYISNAIYLKYDFFTTILYILSSFTILYQKMYLR